ncbi:hypothetical protein PYW08_006090 [Mythimna loreyi]|uniref:Uncharacterized protein n=1 Tax=Mythimna loreyi TaxID=667449 RepID=A0ACC2QLN6_9NEOP|nr:hypothetical protein PYW08_006090 [Mythimna loreyi]
MEHLCVICSRSLTRQRVRHEVSRTVLEARPHLAEYISQHMRIQQDLVNERRHICHRCWVAATRHEARLNQLDLNRVDLQVPENQNQPEPQDLHQNPDQSVDVMSITGYKSAANTTHQGYVGYVKKCLPTNWIRF